MGPQTIADDSLFDDCSYKNPIKNIFFNLPHYVSLNQLFLCY